MALLVQPCIKPLPKAALQQAVMPFKCLQVRLFVELFSSKFQGPFFKALRSENDEQLMEAAKSLEYGLEVYSAQCRECGGYSSDLEAAQHLQAFSINA